ncbi:MAG: radical SAM protein [Spirochaetales bacterium]|nr:radical SAM protein [Spirochaetales bacterium]
MTKQGNAVSWNICEACNYDCSYCAQGRLHRGFPSPGDAEAIARFLAGLAGGWEVKISGGEPFFYPGFIDTVRILVGGGVKISVVTNFSFSFGLYTDFLAVTGDSLRSFSVSFHREKTAFHRFLRKCLKIKQRLDRLDHASMVVNSVVVPGEIADLIRIKKELEKNNIRFYPQFMRKKGKAIRYNKKEKDLIRDLTGGAEDPFLVNRGYSFRGRTCYAGSRYFIVTMTGECFTCYPGKRSGKGSLGAIKDGSVRLLEDSLICPYETCPCSVPANRGIISSSIIAD